MKPLLLLVGSMVVNNAFLSLLLGAPAFLGLSTSLETAVGLGLATTLAMVLSAVAAWSVQQYLLVPLDVTFLQPVAFALAVFCLVQVLQTILSRVWPGSRKVFGTCWPVVGTNCAVLGVALLLIGKGYSLGEGVVFGLGSGLGVLVALAMLAGIRSELRLADVPESWRGLAVALLSAGMLSLSFRGFAGLINL